MRWRSPLRRWQRVREAHAALAQDLLGTAQMATEDLIQRYVRPEQLKGRRRNPTATTAAKFICSCRRSYRRRLTGVLPLLFSGTGTPACAFFATSQSVDFGFRTTSHSMSARGQAEAWPTEIQKRRLRL